MKTVLIVDESQAVRETLALILGRDFVVIQRPAAARDGRAFSAEKADLLILGISSFSTAEVSNLSEIASQVPFPVLFLVESKQVIEPGSDGRNFDYLVKPFNPYDLKAKIVRLLNRPRPRPEAVAPAQGNATNAAHLEFPYLPPSTSVLAKRFALSGIPVLILAEVGCGQERVARAMRSLNGRAGPGIAAFLPRFSKELLVEQMAQVCRREGRRVQQFTLFLHGVDTLSSFGQSSLLSFLQEEEERGREFWILSSSRTALLERAYRGEFLEGLYYRVATLTLPIPPLRERLQDLPALAAHIAQQYSHRLGLSNVTFSDEALERMKNYLWFGNMGEMESVVARTIAVHRKARIEAQDLLFGITGEEEFLGGGPAELGSSAGEFLRRTQEGDSTAARLDAVQEKEQVQAKAREQDERPVPEREKAEKRPQSNNGDYPDLKILINELAHELKNPMVTIKTFAQLLSERFDDATFRIRFQETVGGDIERMDDLLESLLDFSRFAHPLTERIFVHEQLRQILEELAPECIRREATIRWGRKAEEGEVFADEVQFRYALTNVLRTVLVEIKPKGEIQIDIEEKGGVSLSYLREGARMSSFTQYLGLSSGQEQENLPIRILLAKIVLMRIGGRIDVNNPYGDKVLIRVELPAP